MDLNFYFGDRTDLSNNHTDHFDSTQTKAPIRCKIPFSTGHQRLTDLNFGLTVYFIAIRVKNCDVVHRYFIKSQFRHYLPTFP